MRLQQNVHGLDRALQERVLARLGFSSVPTVDLSGLRSVYAAWCAAVPFDNVRKMIALRVSADRPLPGASADDFFGSWITHGAGGTCWPTSNALFELLASLGFNARRVAGSMRDLGVITHASVKVRLNDCEWLVDSSMLTNVPLPLTDEVFVGSDPVFAVEVEPTGGTHVVWAEMPPNSNYIPCRLLVDSVNHEYYVARYEESRARSPFNQRLYARRNQPHEMVIFVGNSRFSKTAEGLKKIDLSPTELCDSLRQDIGLSEALVEQWRRCGALEASFEPPSGPKPPPITNRPPSHRISGVSQSHFSE